MMDYRMQLVGGLHEIEAEAWDELAEPRGLLLSHRFLLALEQTGCVGGNTGWEPCHALLWQGDMLMAACPLYVKYHSYGEFVFDWAWADAYARAGLDYFPKWLCAIPFTPVPGARLMARHETARRTLLAGLLKLAAESKLSSLHLLFPDEAEAAVAREAGLLERTGVQFHWFNRGYADFDAYLSALSQAKRKKVRAERRRVRDQGLVCRVIDGAEPGALTEPVIESVWQCYVQTYRDHHSKPYLTREFFARLGSDLAPWVLLCVAENPGGLMAMSLLLRNHPGSKATRLYGRYWGALASVPLLHFELCYYQPIEWAIAHGIECIEGGAQGEHKLARGFEPVPTRSLHWLADPRFRRAVKDFLQHEGHGMARYLDELEERNPVRQTDPLTDALTSPSHRPRT
jgi:predicted N-acyltransferase